MPLQVPDLDDRTYPDLVAEGIRLIPRYAPVWTNHNASDPGITLLELFAFLTEGLIYELNRVSDANKAKFLKLLTGTTLPVQDHGNIETGLREAAVAVRTPTRAVTCDDFEGIALEATQDDPDSLRVKRCKCFPRCHVEAEAAGGQLLDRPGHTSLIFVGADPWADAATVDAIKQKLLTYFEPKRLLTSRLHVYGPRYVDVGLKILIAVRPGFSRTTVKDSVLNALGQFFDPLQGGLQGEGWPFGQNIYTSDIYRLLENIDGLDYVRSVDFSVSDRNRLARNEMGEVIDVRLRREELPRVQVAEVSFAGVMNSSLTGR
jgi:hypothetical protein